MVMGLRWAKRPICSTRRCSRSARRCSCPDKSIRARSISVDTPHLLQPRGIRLSSSPSSSSVAQRSLAQFVGYSWFESRTQLCVQAFSTMAAVVVWLDGRGGRFVESLSAGSFSRLSMTIFPCDGTTFNR